MSGSTPSDEMGDYESGPYCEHWNDPAYCWECAKETHASEIAALQAAAWDAGYQARQNDLGAADVTPNPYRKNNGRSRASR